MFRFLHKSKREPTMSFRIKKFLSLVLLSLTISLGGLHANLPFTFLDFCGPYQYEGHFDLLYWKAKEKAFVLTNETSPVFFTDNFTEARVLHPNFDWNFGWRIGAGLFSPCNFWNATFDWTHYHTCIHQHRFTNSNDLTNVENQQGMFPIWALSSDIIAGDYVSEANLHGKLSLDYLDLKFSQLALCKKCFEVHPYIGIRTAWIQQHANIRYIGGIFLTDIIAGGVSLNGVDRVHLKNDFWGIGPRLGFEPRFNIGNGFSLYGDAAISALCGCFTVRQKEVYLDLERFHHHKHPIRLKWAGDLAVGVSWNTLLCQRYLLNFQLGWEYHIFFHQLELKGDEFHLVSHNRDLEVQGITFSSLLEF